MRKVFLAFIFTLFLISFLLGRANTTRAGMDTENIRYTSVKVEYGDSLESISEKYNNIGISNDEYSKYIEGEINHFSLSFTTFRALLRLSSSIAA